jgi:hypothetical protein
MAVGIARQRWRVKLSEVVSRRRNRCADDGIGRREARATIGKELSIGESTQLGYAFLHSTSFFTMLFTCE